MVTENYCLVDFNVVWFGENPNVSDKHITSILRVKELAKQENNRSSGKLSFFSHTFRP
jgi:hypothetical protein